MEESAFGFIPVKNSQNQRGTKKIPKNWNNKTTYAASLVVNLIELIKLWINKDIDFFFPWEAGPVGQIGMC